MASAATMTTASRPRMPHALSSLLSRLRRPGITAQIFIAVLATTSVVTSAVSVATQWSFHRGFIGYLNEQAVARMEAAVPRLRDAYARNGNWDFVRDRPDVWFGLVGVERLLPADGTRSAGGREMMASDLLGAGRRMALLDSQRQHVIGFPLTLADSEQREIVVEGQTVGWVTIATIQSATDSAALNFLGEQHRVSLAAGLLGLAMAALIAAWAARRLLAPLRDMAAATHRLAAGAYDTRLRLARHDEIGRLADDFNQLALKLERTEAARRDFMADVSHELRTPLAVLRGELEAIEDGVRAATPDLIRALQREVAALGKLVDDLHVLALADIGALSYRKSDMDLVELIEDEVSVMRNAASERGLALTFEAAQRPLVMFADADRMRQLLHNLLVNALRYTDAGGEVQVRLHRSGNEMCLDLMDTPPGVPDEALDRLFERFYRVEGSRGRSTGGTGLGLAICRSIVEAHGGRIRAHRSPLGGVWIDIRLPAGGRATVT
jgi:two-component system sensor histidine kinase BaeS